MARLLTALGAGLLFGFGLGLSQMVDPAKIIGFLDVAGDWDPSLALVMIGALAVTLPVFRLVLRRTQPLLDREFFIAARSKIDTQLVGGAAIFGVGWGLAGFCPGPAVASLAYGLQDSVIFIAAMAVGAGLSRLVLTGKTPEESATA